MLIPLLQILSPRLVSAHYVSEDSSTPLLALAIAASRSANAPGGTTDKHTPEVEEDRDNLPPIVEMLL
jgi:hypothetical protein